MEGLTQKTEAIMEGRFGKDTVIALATTAGETPFVRYVDAYYDDGSFYVLTYALSNKMQQLMKKPIAAIAGEWFTAHGNAKNLGWVCAPENRDIYEKMKLKFAGWIDNGHNNFQDVNTCILEIELTEGVLFADGSRYDIDFTR